MRTELAGVGQRRGGTDQAFGIFGGTSGAWLGTRLKVTLVTLPCASMSVLPPRHTPAAGCAAVDALGVFSCRSLGTQLAVARTAGVQADQADRGHRFDRHGSGRASAACGFVGLGLSISAAAQGQRDQGGAPGSGAGGRRRERHHEVVLFQAAGRAEHHGRVVARFFICAAYGRYAAERGTSGWLTRMWSMCRPRFFSPACGSPTRNSSGWSKSRKLSVNPSSSSALSCARAPRSW